MGQAYKRILQISGLPPIFIHNLPIKVGYKFTMNGDGKLKGKSDCITALRRYIFSNPESSLATIVPGSLYMIAKMISTKPPTTTIGAI